MKNGKPKKMATTTPDIEEIRTVSGAADVTQQNVGLCFPTSHTRSSSIGLRHGRVYDSQNGKTCHQCRQKTLDLTVLCNNEKNQKTLNRRCTILFCRKCLLNRYGENAEEVALLGNWKCPKCRGICNCSFCMKRRGQLPTGPLVRTAKANGFCSVSEMLLLKADEKFGPPKIINDVGKSLGRQGTPSEISTVKNNDSGSVCNNDKDGDTSKGTCNTKRQFPKKVYNKEGMAYKRDAGGRLIKIASNGKIPVETSSVTINEEDIKMLLPDIDTIHDSSAKDMLGTKVYTSTKNALKIKGKGSDVEISLPQGIELKTVAAVEVPTQDVGHALQFLKFCEAFGQVLDLREGQPELLLQELVCGRNKYGRHQSPIIQFHMQLLSMILKDSGKDASLCQSGKGNSWLQALKECILDSQCPLKELQMDFSNVIDYDDLDTSTKFRILVFLCDEALDTEHIRKWIDEESLTIFKSEVDKPMQKNMKHELQDDFPRVILPVNGVPLSASHREDLVLKVKQEARETLEETDLEPEKIDNEDPLRPRERWYSYNVEQNVAIDQYISSMSSKIPKEKATTKGMDDVIVDAFVHQHKIGNRKSGRFTTKAYENIINEFRDGPRNFD